jgi:hypothetical protein
VACLLSLGGCSGYQNEWLYPTDVTSVYVEMFDTQGFRRGYEVELTDAICKRIESHTPYKIVSDRQVADTVLSGRLGITVSVLAGDPYAGTPLEKETLTTVTVTWKNLKTGELLIDDQEVQAAASYSDQLGQTEDYALNRAVNSAAQRVVELMEKPW